MRLTLPVSPQVLLGVGANPTRGSFATPCAGILPRICVTALRAVPEAQRFLLQQVLFGHAVVSTEGAEALHRSDGRFDLASAG